MNFKKAYEALKQGADIKRPSWKGFWRKENDTIMLYCKDGSKIPFMQTECIFRNLNNVVADDWEVVSGVDVTDLNVNTFTFGEAISRLKRGGKVSRKGWSSQEMFIVYQKGHPQGIPCNKQTASAWGMREGDLLVCNPYLQIKNANGSHSTWSPSIEDLLAEDWISVK